MQRTIWDINDTMLQYWIDNAAQMDAYEEQIRFTGKSNNRQLQSLVQILGLYMAAYNEQDASNEFIT